MPRKPKPAPESLQHRLQRLRKSAGMSQADLAMKAGLLLGRVTYIEQGMTTDPKLSTISALANALGVSLDELAG